MIKNPINVRVSWAHIPKEEYVGILYDSMNKYFPVQPSRMVLLATRTIRLPLTGGLR